MTLMTSEKNKIVNYGSFADLMEMEKKNGNRKMKFLIGLQIFTIIFMMLMLGAFYFVGYPIVKERQVFMNVTNNVIEPKDNITTLYALDPLAHSFCFGDGQYGKQFTDWSLYNRNSEIDFNTYSKGSFRVGIQGGQNGIIINLGSSADLQKKYKYQETSGDGQGFASIHRKNKTILIQKGAAYNHTFQPMEESAELFREGPSTGTPAVVNLGHLYILRITDPYQRDFERIVKMLVIAYEPNEWVTFRWEVLI